MSLDAVVDVGHGRRPDGKYDPGTIAQNGTREHDQAHEVTRVVLAALRRSGVSVDSDDHGTGGAHDPNWSGSVARVNRLDPRCAVEVHFDWYKAQRGGFGIHHGPSEDGKRLAAAIATAYRRRGLGLRYDGTYADTRGLAFVRSTECPAVIWECDRVGAATTAELRSYGEAIAEGIATYLGRRYVPPSGGGGGSNVVDDQTQPGETFADAWDWAVREGVMSSASEPTDTVEKQELAAHLKRFAATLVGRDDAGEGVTMDEVMADLRRRLS